MLLVPLMSHNITDISCPIYESLVLATWVSMTVSLGRSRQGLAMEF